MTRYLTPADLEYQIRNDVQTAIEDGSTTRLLKAELAAVNVMKSYLKKRYDLDNIFFPVYEYKADQAFTAGQLCHYKTVEETDEQTLVYEALEATTGNLPTDATKWQLSEKRNHMIIMYLGDITVYHFYSADTAGFTLTHVEKRYKEAMEWLKAVAAGDIEADLPQLTSEDEAFTSEIRYSSNPRENHRY